MNLLNSTLKELYTSSVNEVQLLGKVVDRLKDINDAVQSAAKKGGAAMGFARQAAGTATGQMVADYFDRAKGVKQEQQLIKIYRGGSASGTASRSVRPAKNPPANDALAMPVAVGQGQVKPPRKMAPSKAPDGVGLAEGTMKPRRTLNPRVSLANWGRYMAEEMSEEYLQKQYGTTGAFGKFKPSKGKANKAAKQRADMAEHRPDTSETTTQYSETSAETKQKISDMAAKGTGKAIAKGAKGAKGRGAGAKMPKGGGGAGAGGAAGATATIAVAAGWAALETSLDVLQGGDYWAGSNMGSYMQMLSGVNEYKGVKPWAMGLLNAGGILNSAAIPFSNWVSGLFKGVA